MFGHSLPGRPVSRREITDYRLSDTLNEIEDLALGSDIEQDHTNDLIVATQKLKILQEESKDTLEWESALLANLEEQGTIHDVKLNDESASVLYGTLDNFMDGHIDSIERLLIDAVARGVLDETTVSAAVQRWRQADNRLDESQEAHENRERKVEEALKEYNNSTAEITSLVNKTLD